MEVDLLNQKKMKYIFQNIIMHGDGQLGETHGKNLTLKLNFGKDLKNQKMGITK